MKHNTIPIFLLLAAALVFGCAKPTPFGSDLLDAEDYEFTDTLTLRCTLEREDSLVTSDKASTSDYLLCGQLNDPLFGTSRAEIFTLFAPNALGPNFKNATLDSVVMFLRYDAPGFYGDTAQAQTLRVHRIAEGSRVETGKTYYSHNSLPVAEQIGEVTNLLAKPHISATLFDTVNKAPYLRIPLDKTFGQELLNTDSLTLTTDTLFWKKYRGLRISSETAANPGAIMAFDLNSTGFSRIRVYYTQNDTLKKTFDFLFVAGNKFNHFTHDYTGSTVDPYLNQVKDDLLFVQGMGGLRLKVEIPYAHHLTDVAINKAELELTPATLPGDNALLKPASQLVFTEHLGDTIFVLTSDVIYALGFSSSSQLTFFGGYPEKTVDQGMSIDRYRLTLTRRFQAMTQNSSGEPKGQTVYINVYPQSRSAMRTVFYGPKNATFPAKLALKYTKVR